MSDSHEYIHRRDDLRRLSQARVEVGLRPYPTNAEVLSCAYEYNINRLEAHDRLMQEGVRILDERELRTRAEAASADSTTEVK